MARNQNNDGASETAEAKRVRTAGFLMSTVYGVDEEGNPNQPGTVDVTPLLPTRANMRLAGEFEERLEGEKKRLRESFQSMAERLQRIEADGLVRFKLIDEVMAKAEAEAEAEAG